MGLFKNISGIILLRFNCSAFLIFCRLSFRYTAAVCTRFPIISHHFAVNLEIVIFRFIFWLQPVSRIAIICCLLNAINLAISIILATSKAMFLHPFCSKSFLSLLKNCRLQPVSRIAIIRGLQNADNLLLAIPIILSTPECKLWIFLSEDQTIITNYWMTLHQDLHLVIIYIIKIMCFIHVIYVCVYTQTCPI